MTLLTISAALAKNAGMTVPDVVITSPRREWIEAAEISNAVGEELSRRVDWGVLTKSVTVSGTGLSDPIGLPSDFMRIVRGVGVTHAGTTLRPLTRAEWASLTPVEGVPRYFLLEGRKISFWPYLASGSSAAITYQSDAWCSNGTANWAADTDTSLIDEDIMEKGLIVRWRRQKGMDYADYEAEFEAALADHANFDDRSRL